MNNSADTYLMLNESNSFLCALIRLDPKGRPIYSVVDLHPNMS